MQSSDRPGSRDKASSGSPQDSIQKTSEIPDKWEDLAVEQILAFTNGLKGIGRDMRTIPFTGTDVDDHILSYFLDNAGPRVLVFPLGPSMDRPESCTKFERLAYSLWVFHHSQKASCVLAYLSRMQLSNKNPPFQRPSGAQLLVSLIGQLLHLKNIFDCTDSKNRWVWFNEEKYKDCDQFVADFDRARDLLR